MATYYWVGGSGTWDATTTTNWASGSGGAGGVAAPTSSDNVVFDGNSGAAPTVTIGTTATCANMTASSPTSGTLTFAFGTTGILSFNGNWTNPSTLFATTGSGSSTGAISYKGSGSSTFTTNGISFAQYIFVSASGTLTLGSAFTCTNSLTVVQGTFSTGASNYALTVTQLATSGTLTRSIALNASTCSLTGSSPLSMSAVTGLTFNAGTSQINIISSAANFTSAGLTFYNVTFTATVSGTSVTVGGVNAFNNLTRNPPSAVGVIFLTFAANQTINGSLTIPAGSGAPYRTVIRASTIGTPVTITAASVSLIDTDFQDIVGAGAASWSGTRIGDLNGNSGISFTPGATKYWNLAAGGSWSSTAWALTGGGTPAINNFPLAQDTAVFQATGLNSGATVTLNANYYVGSIDMSARTSNTMTFATSFYYLYFLGSFTSGTGVTLTNAGSSIFFYGRSSNTITSAGSSFPCSVTFNMIGGSITFQDAFTQSSSFGITLTNGTLNLNGKTVTTGSFANAAETKNITFNGGTLACIGSAGAFNNSYPTGFTTTAGTGTGIISFTSASAKTFYVAGSVYNCTVQNAGAGALTFSGAGTITSITNTVQPTSFIFTSGNTITVSNWNVNGTAGNLVTIGATSTGAATLSKSSGVVSSNYLSISHSTATGGATWYAGANSSNVTGNSGWIFTNPPSGNNSNFLMFF